MAKNYTMITKLGCKHLTIHLGHVTGSSGATFQTDAKKIECSCGPKCCVKDRSIKNGSIQGANTIATRPWRFWSCAGIPKM